MPSLRSTGLSGLGWQTVCKTALGLSGGTRLKDNSDYPSHRRQQRTVWLMGTDCPQFKSQETNIIELVLDTVRWTLEDYPRLASDCPQAKLQKTQREKSVLDSIGQGSRTVRTGTSDCQSIKTQNHSEKTWFWTGRTPIGGLSVGKTVDCPRITNQNRIAVQKNASHFDPRICGEIFNNCHETW
jgi:hypothetical protein